MHDFGLLPLRQMSGRLYGHELALRQLLHKPLTFLIRNRPVLLAPDDEDRPWMLAHAYQLLTLIGVAVRTDFREPGAAKTFVLNLVAIPFRPIRKVFGMEKVSKLIVCPGSFIEYRREVVPGGRHILQKRQLIWL